LTSVDDTVTTPPGGSELLQDRPWQPAEPGFSTPTPSSGL
jgi:hypothetical protein